MKCLAVYPRALHNLKTQVNIHRDQQFRIKVVEPVPPSEPFQQASLQQTLSALSDDSKVVIDRYRELIGPAARRISPTRRPNDKTWLWSSHQGTALERQNAVALPVLVYPRALPNADIESGVKQQVLNKLVKHLKVLLDQEAREGKSHTPDSTSRPDASLDLARAQRIDPKARMDADELALHQR
ncbi:hypothetical protein FRB95_007295 [Tulasnella sp. JGI-2019a]|nr:hypothetical protein FRB95_007295 [Tulasnella sp. JGI-2019a]